MDLSPIRVEAGDFFLLHAEPYLGWVCVLERALAIGHVVLQMKGLELQR